MLLAVITVVLSSPLSPGRLTVSFEQPQAVELVEPPTRLLAMTDAAEPTVVSPEETRSLRGPIILAIGGALILAGTISYLDATRTDDHTGVGRSMGIAYGWGLWIGGAVVAAIGAGLWATD